MTTRILGRLLFCKSRATCGEAGMFNKMLKKNYWEVGTDVKKFLYWKLGTDVEYRI